MPHHRISAQAADDCGNTRGNEVSARYFRHAAREALLACRSDAVLVWIDETGRDEAATGPDDVARDSKEANAAASADPILMIFSLRSMIDWMLADTGP